MEAGVDAMMMLDSGGDGGRAHDRTGAAQPGQIPIVRKDDVIRLWSPGEA